MEVFPFGNPVEPVTQRDRGPKRVFVLGVYASAVHATWFSRSGKQLVRALGVASEPEIFWRGENASEIVSRVRIPSECGYLLPADCSLNGSSGRALDALYLLPLRCSRSDTWLCDLLPRSRMNPSQGRAIQAKYWPLARKGIVPEATWPAVPRWFSDSQRNAEILQELRSSRAELLVLLGDAPVKEFLSPLAGTPSSLRALTGNGRNYGRTSDVSLGGKAMQVLPLVHPRQAARLGSSSSKWAARHKQWIHRSLTTRCS
jgi:hypothetical protein